MHRLKLLTFWPLSFLPTAYPISRIRAVLKERAWLFQNIFVSCLSGCRTHEKMTKNWTKADQCEAYLLVNRDETTWVLSHLRTVSTHFHNRSGPHRPFHRLSSQMLDQS